MIKVQSLKHLIIAQFTAILLPVVAVIAYQTVHHAERTAALDELMQWHTLARQAADHYTRFSEGVAQADDTLELSPPALRHLWQARDNLDELGRRAASAPLSAHAQRMAQMARQLESDRSLLALLRVQDKVRALRSVTHDALADYDHRFTTFIQRSIAASHTETRWVMAVSLAVMLMTVFFVFHMIHYLSRPLALAVSIADRIAEGQPVDRAEFDLKHDVGHLIHSLGRMYHNLKAFEDEAGHHRRGLEEKIRQLAQSQSNLAEAQRLAHFGNWRWETDKQFGEWSDEVYHILGLAPGSCDPTWQTFLSFVDTADQPQLREGFRKLLKAPGTLSIEHYVTLPDGMFRCIHSHISSRAGADGRVMDMHGTIQDITERKAAEEKMHYLAMYDTLTGLPNRQLFNEQTAKAVARAKRNDERLAIMFIDLDRFKRINDTMGHAVGDMLLKEVATRLSGCVRANDCIGRDTAAEDAPGRVARLAGDEFTVTLDALSDPKDAARVAQRIIDELSRPFMLNGEEVVVTASVGIAVFPEDGEQAELLLQHADVAMYQAKQQGKANYQFFAGAMNSAAVEKLKLEAALRIAIERHEFELHYQPKIDIVHGRICGVEALMRWRHPEWGMVMPYKFIPVAEEMGLIVRMGDWVLEEACRQLKAWHDAGHADIEMAINLASPSFRQPDLVERVAAVLRNNGVEPARLCLEATESILMRDADATLTTLRALRELGVKLSVDDFGTGYSSLSYLRRFPIDQVKIDRSFVKDVTECPDDAAIVAAIVSLARTLKLDIVAEGVETVEQARTLAEQGCRTMQGYLFSKPVPVAELDALLADGTSLAALARRAGASPRKPALVA